MTVADEVVRALRDRPDGLTDAELAALLGKRHQHVNLTCRRLADKGAIVRGDSMRGILNKISGSMPVQPTRQVAEPRESSDYEWAREGNVQARIVAYLAAGGWSITRVADTSSREHGADIIAERTGLRLLVEVKGWPSTTYARGDRAGQPKPTQPTLQAAHWFADALATLIRRGSEPEVTLAMGLPDMPRYRSLLGEAGWALDRLEIAVYLVTSDGAVWAWERES